MDLSYLTSKNPEVELRFINKLYFGKYPFRVCLTLRCVYAVKNTSGELLDQRIKLLQTSKDDTGRAWFRNPPTVHEAKLLKDFSKIKLKHDSRLKFRFEQDDCQAYAESFDDMQAYIKDLGGFAEYISEANYPRDQHELDLMSKGSMIVRKKLNYEYKVTSRSGCYDRAALAQVWKYLASTDEVKLTTKKFAPRGEYFGSRYFFVNDTRILDFVKLIIPDFIQKIEKMEEVT